MQNTILKSHGRLCRPKQKDATQSGCTYSYGHKQKRKPRLSTLTHRPATKPNPILACDRIKVLLQATPASPYPHTTR